MGLRVSLAVWSVVMAAAIASGLYLLALAGGVFPLFARDSIGRALSRAFPDGLPAPLDALVWVVLAAAFGYVFIYATIQAGILS